MCTIVFGYRDNKLEILSDLREELDRSRVTISKLTQEKRDLSEDAKNVRVYRDEVETLRIQSGKVEKLEIELVKYRQKAEDTDYLKKRISVSCVFTLLVYRLVALYLECLMYLTPH